MANPRRGKRATLEPETLGQKHVLEALMDEWAIEILQGLDRSPKLYAEIQREWKAASQASLTQSLRSLQDAGLVWRKVYPTSPSRVEYSLTALGRSFMGPLKAFCEWACLHERELGAAAARRKKQFRKLAKSRKTTTKTDRKA
jgi:DNA-binding HxlR family transcriptional regulator